MVAKKAAPRVRPTIKLDLSYGPLPPQHPYLRPQGFDPRRYPWTLKADSVSEAYSRYLLQRIPARDRGRFMDELWRVLVVGGKALIIVPYWANARAVQDPLAEWPPFSEQSFLYFNKGFRTDNQLDYNMTCDFDFVYGYTLDPETAAPPDDTRPFWIKHYGNAVSDLHVTLIKRKA